MKKYALLLLLSTVLVGCSPSTPNDKTGTQVSSTQTSEKELLKLIVYNPQYDFENKSFFITGKADPSLKLVASSENKKNESVTVDENGKISYSGVLKDASYEIEFSDGVDSQVMKIDSLSEIELKEEKLKAQIEENKKNEEENKIKREKEAAERAEKEKAEAEQKKKDEEAAAQRAKEEIAAQYETGITFENLARNPDTYQGKKVKFYGKIVQVIKGDDRYQFRFAVDDNYDQMLYIEISDDQISNNRLLEDDYITIKGSSYGEYTYKSAIGGEITVPAVIVDSFELNQ